MRTTSSQSRRKAVGRHPLARTAPFAAAVVATLALGAAGCGNGGRMVNAGSQSTSPSASPTSAPASVPPNGTAPPGPGSTAPSGTSVPQSSAPQSAGSGTPAAVRPEAAGSRCTVTDLTMRLGRGDPGAGQVYYPLRFTNTSSHTCVLDGFPGVSLIRGDGSTIGRPAGREGSRGAAVGLKPGATVEADLHTLNQGVNGDSCWRKPTLLKAYPPGSKDAMTLATGDPVVCGGTFDVGSIH